MNSPTLFAHKKRKKAFTYLGHLAINTQFELPSESGFWVKMGIADDKGMVPVGVAGSHAVSRKLHKSTTIVLDL